jgi:hypothetical protein
VISNANKILIENLKGKNHSEDLVLFFMGVKSGLILRKVYKMSVSENMVLRKIFGLKTEEEVEC